MELRALIDSDEIPVSRIDPNLKRNIRISEMSENLLEKIKAR